MMTLRALLLSLLLVTGFAADQSQLAPAANTQLRAVLHSDPKTLDPLLVEEDAGDLVRFLTHGFLLRINRGTQQAEADIAASWKISPDGKRITFRLRDGARFSDGSSVTAGDVTATFSRLFDPAVKSPLADPFQSSAGKPAVRAEGSNTVILDFPAPIAGVERLFDQVPVLPARQLNGAIGAGPFVISSRQAGSQITLARNPYYWKRDSAGRSLPYLASIRFDIQSNRDVESLRLRRGDIHLVSTVDPETFDQLSQAPGVKAIDVGPSNESEMIWFNQAPKAAIPEFKKQWFRSRAFRKAVSHAIHRADIARLVYRGHAEPASGPFSRANKLWFNAKVQPDTYSLETALRLLASDGFTKTGNILRDRNGNPVEFSLVTNSGNKSRARIASLIQEDLNALGIRTSVVPLDFPSLIERITRTSAYEACLLGLVNVDTDPNGQMNVWQSSAANHQWNPRQPSPETPWEAELDRLMSVQATALHFKQRKAAFDRVQEIISEQAPFIYLVSKNTLSAASVRLSGVEPSSLTPQLLWNAERLRLLPESGKP